jgi:hypothetical protein
LATLVGVAALLGVPPIAFVLAGTAAGGSGAQAATTGGNANLQLVKAVGDGRLAEDDQAGLGRGHARR